jgi:LmbE family N-acetylglucosaminyl deacetylase
MQAPCAPPRDPDLWADAVTGRLELPDLDDLLVVAAHPDDETIGAGRLLAALDVTARAVTLTAGERCFDGTGEDPDRVAHARLAEWRCALGELGVEPLRCGHLPDGGLEHHLDDAVALLADALASGSAVLAPWRHDPHPDHAAAGTAAARVAEAAGVPLLEYVVWAPYWLDPSDVAAHGGVLVAALTGPREDERWRRALGCFTSQFHPWRPGWPPVVPADLVDRHHRQWLVARG